MKNKNLFTAAITVLIVVTLPYLLAALAAGKDYVFTGVLLNPFDGATYLAKMYQGWEGSWRFTLSFTAEPGEGAYLFLYYLFLGHVARITTLPLMVVYHLFRVIGAGLLLFALLGFYERIFSSRQELFRLAYWLTVIGAGMGWLVIFFGLYPSDFWIAEAYPFLAMMINPHFPLGLTMLVYAFTLLIDPGMRWRSPQLLLLGLLMAIILPFGEVVAVIIGGVWVLWTWIETKHLEWLPLVSLGILGGPTLLYQFWATQADPILAGWNAQNLTPAPPVWDFILSLSPALLLSIVGLVTTWKQPHTPATRLLMGWLVFGVVMIYFPVPLQRRFMTGYFIPVVALAIMGLDVLLQRYPKRARLFTRLTFWLSIPTNILLLVIISAGMLMRAPEYYLSRSEADAMTWLHTQAPAKSLVLASPQISLWIPGFSGQRIVYAHPYETVNAEVEEEQVLKFFMGGVVDTQYLAERKIDFVYIGPRGEKDDEKFPAFNPGSLKPVYQNDQVTIYSTKP